MKESSRSTSAYARRTPTRRQRGSALIVALIFLILTSLLAISACERSLLQERMAGSLRNAQQAQASAETALRGAEYKIWSVASHAGVRLHCLDGAISHDDGCVIYRPSSAPYRAGGAVTRFLSAQGWLPGVGVTYTGTTQGGFTRNSAQPTASLARNPVYLIEDLGSEAPPGADGLRESGSTGPNNDDPAAGSMHIYRITARATGGNPNVVSVVQSTFDAPASH
ncbi:MAG TPA: PilX N-terminal domain-containing pilus assembly protein [Dyella sp.]|uniref:pilus assembly PilX family protein n=1 Tax=Dyella sp. TaxID=1869338 RepID=UPI002BAFF51F|nr:PilX N-terminal domain-containing pilus assembly protein [Dyella sp.]HTV84375.1 PilX N-terminal domain-containing pilus assembly protein [Dyella sp.]